MFKSLEELLLKFKKISIFDIGIENNIGLITALLSFVFLIFWLKTKKQNLSSAITRTVIILLVCLSISSPFFKIRAKIVPKSEKTIILADISKSITEKSFNAFKQMLVDLNFPSSNDILVYSFSEDLEKTPIKIKASEIEKIDLSKLRNKTKLKLGETNLKQTFQSFFDIENPSSVYLFSDGIETTELIEEYKEDLKRQSTRFYPILPENELFEENGLSISSLDNPLVSNSGDKISIKASISNSTKLAKEGNLFFLLDGEKIKSFDLNIGANSEKLVEIESPELSGGLHRVQVALLNKGDDISKLQERNNWVSVKEKDKILLLSPDSREERNIFKILSYRGYSVVNYLADNSSKNSEEYLPNKDKFSKIILNNISKDMLPKGFLAKLENYVATGGSLLTVGGDKSYGLGGYIDSPLEEISPLKFLPPRQKKKSLRAAVALVLDKSKSMEKSGRILSAQRSAVAAIQTLKPKDYVTVIGFDRQPFQIIEMMEAQEAKQVAEDRLGHLTPFGGTILLHSLQLARAELANSKASRKHIIILTDGEFENPAAENISEVNRARDEGITISTVALGSEREVDVPFLREVAERGKGKFYHVRNPNELPQIFIKDVKVSVGDQEFEERGPYPVAVGKSGVISTSIKDFPGIDGFAQTLPKKGANLELVTKKGQEISPLLASWNYKDGKVISFCSDASGRWTSSWISWSRYATFFSELLAATNNLNLKKDDLDFDLKFSTNGNTVFLELALFDKRALNDNRDLSGELVLPSGAKKLVVFERAKPGKYFSKIKNAETGDYKIDLSYLETKLPRLAFTVDPKQIGEKQLSGTDIGTLSIIANSSGGEINPKKLAQTMEKKEGSNLSSKDDKYEKLKLKELLLIFSFILVIFEAFIREKGQNGV